MEIVLTKPKLEQFIAEQVRSGHFASPIDVVETALIEFMLHPPYDEVDEATRAAILRAEAEFDRGEDRAFSDVAAELRAKYTRS